MLLVKTSRRAFSTILYVNSRLYLLSMKIAPTRAYKASQVMIITSWFVWKSSSSYEVFFRHQYQEVTQKISVDIGYLMQLPQIMIFIFLCRTQDRFLG